MNRFNTSVREEHLRSSSYHIGAFSPPSAIQIFLFFIGFYIFTWCLVFCWVMEFGLEIDGEEHHLREDNIEKNIENMWFFDLERYANEHED